MICRMDFDIVLEILIFDRLQGYCMGYSLCMIISLQNGLISRVFSVFWSSVFAQNNSKLFVERILTYFFGILILTHCKHFA